MKTAWMPIIKEILLLIVAVILFLVLYDCLVKKKSFKESLIERLFLPLFHGYFGRIVYFIVLVAIIFLIYSIIFE